MSLEVTKEIFIKASPETVFPYLTEQEKVEKWFGVIVEIDSKPGGVFKVGAHDDLMVLGEFLEIVPNEKVVFTWGGLEGLAPGESTVEIALKAENGGTQLTLRHYNIKSEEAAESFGQGWSNHAFPLLKLVAEGGETEERCFRKAADCDSNASNEEAA